MKNLKKNILELFAGSRSIGTEAEKIGMNVFSVDWGEYENIDLHIDIGDMKLSDIPFCSRRCLGITGLHDVQYSSL